MKTRAPKKETIPWLEEKLKKLILTEEDTKNISEQERSTFNEINPWAMLKLVSLRYLGTVYRNIISERVAEGQFKAMYYIDFFSGSGVSTIKDSRALCYSSPMIMNLQQKDEKFTKMFFNDGNKRYTEVLESRLDNTKKTDYTVTNKDANKRAEEIISELDEEGHSFIFVDPYSTDFSWKSMETILTLNADIFFLFQTKHMPRTIARASNPKGKPMRFFKDFNKVKEVYKDPYRTKDKMSAIFDLYQEDIRSTRGGETTLMGNIKINGGGYNMLFITKQTGGGSPWFGNAVIPLKNKIESFDSKAVEKTLKVLLKEQSKISDFF